MLRQTEMRKYGIFKPCEKIPFKTQHVRSPENDPVFYSSLKLNELLSQNDNDTKKINGVKYTVIRFLVKTNGQTVFAQEGIPGNSVPAHFQMDNSDPIAANCLTAGNAFFDADMSLFLLNHKSGDFRPSFDSLQFALDAFLTDGIKMSDEFLIHKLNQEGVWVGSYIISKSTLGVEYNKQSFYNDTIDHTATFINDLAYQYKNPLAPEACLSIILSVLSKDISMDRMKGMFNSVIHSLFKKPETKTLTLKVIDLINKYKRCLDNEIKFSLVIQCLDELKEIQADVKQSTAYSTEDKNILAVINALLIKYEKILSKNKSHLAI